MGYEPKTYFGGMARIVRGSHGGKLGADLFAPTFDLDVPAFEELGKAFYINTIIY